MFEEVRRTRPELTLRKLLEASIRNIHRKLSLSPSDEDGQGGAGGAPIDLDIERERRRAHRPS